jgi:hypothetical protein
MEEEFEENEREEEEERKRHVKNKLRKKTPEIKG